MMNIFRSKKNKKDASASRSRQMLHLPSSEMSAVASVIGTLARAIVLWLGVYGLALFIAEAFGLIYTEQYETLSSGMVILKGTSGYIPNGTMLLCAAIASLFLAVGMSSRYTLAALPLGVLVYILHLSTTFGNIALAIENMLRRAFNEILTQMSAHGFFQFSEYRLSDSYSYDPSLLMKEAVMLIIFVLAALVFAFMFKRVHPIPSCLLIMLIIVPIFMYNINRYTLGFAFLLVFIFAAIVMWRFDARYDKGAIDRDERIRKRSEKKAAKAEKRAAKEDKRKASHNALFDTYLAELTKSGSKSSAKKTAAIEKKKLEAAERTEKRAEKADKAEKKAALRREREEAKRSQKALAASIRKLPKQSPERAQLQAQLDLEKQKKKEKAIAARKLRREKAGQKRATAASSGLAGITALAIAFISVLAPYQIAKRDFPILDQIEKFMYYTRDYVTMLLTGDDVDLNEMSLYRELAELAPRKISLEPRELANSLVYVVRSGYNSPVYLRTWVASDYSDETSEWTSADYARIKGYRMMFGDDFTPDSITSEFYHMMFPEETTVTKLDHYESFARYGFIMHQTNIKKIANTDRLLPLPSIHDSMLGILRYDSLLPTRMKYASYYDGVMSSSSFKEGDSFSVLTFSRYMKNDSAARNMEELYMCFIASEKYYKLINIPKLGGNMGTAKDDVNISQPEINQRIDRLNEHFGVTVVENYPTMTDRNEFNAYYMNAILDHYNISEELKTAAVNMVLGEEFAEKFARFYDLHTKYVNYVTQNYTGTSGNERIAALANELLSANGLERIVTEGGVPYYVYTATGAKANSHDVIMTVIDYFKNDFTYSLKPQASSDDTENETVLEKFLFDTKSGYCSHFATAAAMLLREYGFTVRYCEGYIASGFKRDSGASDSLPFTTNVLESDSHAWIEVYFPAIGWTTYECTPSFVEYFYSYPQDAPIKPEPPESTDDPIESTEVPPEESTSAAETSIPTSPSDSSAAETTEKAPGRNAEVLQKYLHISIFLASLAILAAIGVKLTDKIKKRAESAIDIRVCLINAAISKERYDIAPRKHTREITRDLSDYILTIFSEIGYPQKTGELPSEYADRLKIKYAGLSKKDLSDIIYLIQKEEFGHGLNYDELCCLAEYLRELAAGLYPTLKWYDRIRLRYIKHVL